MKIKDFQDTKNLRFLSVFSKLKFQGEILTNEKER